MVKNLCESSLEAQLCSSNKWSAYQTFDRQHTLVLDVPVFRPLLQLLVFLWLNAPPQPIFEQFHRVGPEIKR